MSARSSVSCSSDMEADCSVSLRSSSAFFCRAFRMTTETEPQASQAVLGQDTMDEDDRDWTSII
ncbi:hypothetical protein EYF80_032580 [Liparis tanakae]|uniref:Uncharacterized protein n=1 Tax=Liparis tanakae TaxID=230148 RepID=A0A4Z2GUQ0_9TELE|nr:hypothetical protein EYF80_032580 [Liparis tanakae]